ncbi:MAG: RHS repeat-associated core domain-containing protein [Acidobacteriota bacterium]
MLEANPTISSSTNRINAAGYLYDNAGNVTQEPSAPTHKVYVYDAENHQKEYSYNSQTWRYEYDGDGRRVKKIKPNASYLIFVYDAGGRLVAEYDSGTSAPSAYQTNFLTQDHLGSTRVVTDATGAVTSRLDYLPFGTEISAGIGGRTTAMMYAASSTLRQKFTGHERDEESKLDFAQARYCSSPTGRFMSVDPLPSSGKVAEPQSWNRYPYTINNPMKYIDSSGLIWGSIQTQSGDTTITNYYWYETQAELEKAGATAVQFDDSGIYAYQANTGEYIRLEKDSQNWQGHFTSRDDAILGQGAVEARRAAREALDRELLSIELAMVFGSFGNVGAEISEGGNYGNLSPRRGIALGADPWYKDIARQTGSFHYKQWGDVGLSRRTRNFGSRFNQASRRADEINFELRGVLDGRGMEAAVRAGRAGFFRGNFTNAELSTIYQNPSLFSKTNFFFEGRPVSPIFRPTWLSSPPSSK